MASTLALSPVSPAASHAIRAAKNTRAWGHYMCMMFLKKRDVPLSLYRLARQLEAIKKAGF